MAAELDDPVRGELAGRLGDGGQQGAAARSGLADQAYGAPFGQLAEQLGDVRLAVEQGHVGGAGAEGERADGPAGAERRAALVAARCAARAGLPLVGAGPGLGAVRGPDGHQQPAGDQFAGTRAHALLPEFTGWLSHVSLRPCSAHPAGRPWR